MSAIKEDKSLEDPSKDQDTHDNDSAVVETEEELRARHRRESKDLVTKTTAMKKQATKGEKKKRKEINKKIETLENEMKLRHRDELNVRITIIITDRLFLLTLFFV